MSLQADNERLRRCISMAMGCISPLSQNIDERLAWYRLLDAVEGREPRNSATRERMNTMSEFDRDGIAQCLFNKAMSGHAQWDEMAEPHKEDWRVRADLWIKDVAALLDESAQLRRTSPVPSQSRGAQ